MMEMIWERWRGSPDLVAHIVRATTRALGLAETGTAPSVIEVAVNGDREVFDSADDFRDRVTPEALRRFRHIAIGASNTRGISVYVLLARARAAEHATGTFAGKGALLRVSSKLPAPAAGEEASQEEEEIAKAVKAAVERGRRPEEAVLLIALGSLLLTLMAFISIALVVNLPQSDWWLLAPGLGGVFVTRWLYPPVEIAPPGQTRLALAAKFIGIPVVGLMIAGYVTWLAGLDVRLD